MTEIFVLLHGSDVCTKIDDVERPSWLNDFSRRPIDIPRALV